MSYWTTGHRVMDGHRRKVRKLHSEGKIVAVRLFGRPHYTDAQAAKKGIKHKRGYVNFTNSDKRKNFHR